jgi:hypothetical protein
MRMTANNYTAITFLKALPKVIGVCVGVLVAIYFVAYGWVYGFIPDRSRPSCIGSGEQGQPSIRCELPMQQVTIDREHVAVLFSGPEEGSDTSLAFQ